MLQHLYLFINKTSRHRFSLKLTRFSHLVGGLESVTKYLLPNHKTKLNLEVADLYEIPSYNVNQIIIQSERITKVEHSHAQIEIKYRQYVSPLLSPT